MIWKLEEKFGYGNRSIGKFFTLMDGEDIVFRGFAEAYHVDGRKIETKFAELVEEKHDGDTTVLVFKAENGLVLTETLSYKNGYPVAQCALSDASGCDVETRRLIPLYANGNINDDAIQLWRNIITQKQLLVPFDNDQWLRYEAVPLRVGQLSYDLTVLFDEITREGLLIGALDHEVWKNGISNSYTDTRTFVCTCGVATEGTHDVCQHGTLIGKSVESSRFIIMRGADYRDILEEYGDILVSEKEPMRWNEGVPFGFNAFAGLARKMSNDVFKDVYHFLRDELVPRGFQNNGFIYHNLDGGWQRLDDAERLALKDEIHADGHKAGIYDGPFAIRAYGANGFDDEIPGFPGTTWRDVALKDEYGNPILGPDGQYPFDLTHPVWKEITKKKFEDFKKWGYDYLKIDFLTQGAMEGVHYDKNIRTGRQALTQAYKFMQELVENMGYPFFLSTSIAPIFPFGFGHSRRFCCDSFGINDYIEYVLNTQTYAWWENGRLNDYNDPDHVVLHQSFNVKRVTKEGEARARYTTGAICGTLMLLSDDYTLPEAQERALKFATNEEVNKLVRSRVSFRPVEQGGASASHAFTAKIDGDQYVALFSWMGFPEHLEVCPVRAGIERGVYRDLWTGKTYDCTDGKIVWDAQECDALLLKLEK